MTITKSALGAVVIVLLAALPAQAQLPQTLDEMKAQHGLLGTTPEGAVKNFIDACFVYMNPDTRDSGREMLQYLALPLRGEANWDRLSSLRLFSQYLIDPDRQHIWRSYAKGATPENGYRMDPNNWELNFERGYLKDDGRGIPVNLHSSGADEPRAVYVKQDEKTGLWHINAWDELLEDVRPPLTSP